MKYRRVSPMVWVDDKFLALSPPKPNAQTLWLYLLTSDHRTVIPGVIRNVGPATLAECLRWPERALRTCWEEIARAEMATADWSARVIWMPNGIKYEPAENPNQVKAWRATWEELPRCAITSQIAAAVWASLNGKPPAWLEAWGTVQVTVPPTLTGTVPPTLSKQGTGTGTGEREEGFSPGNGSTSEARAGAWLEQFPVRYFEARGVGFRVNHARDWPNAVAIAESVTDDVALDTATDVFLRCEHRDLANQTRTPGRMLAMLPALLEHVQAHQRRAS